MKTRSDLLDFRFTVLAIRSLQHFMDAVASDFFGDKEEAVAQGVVGHAHLQVACQHQLEN